MAEDLRIAHRPEAEATLRDSLDLKLPADSDEAIQKLFSFNKDSPELEAREFSRILKLYEQTLARQREEGERITLGKTTGETFAKNEVPHAMLAERGCFYLLPRKEDAKAIVISDLHASKEPLEAAIRLFLEDPNQRTHLVSLGDNFTYGPPERPLEALQVLKALFKLACLYPDRVHLLRGNHEVTISLWEEWSKTVNVAFGDWGAKQNAERTLRIGKQMPLALFTENGLSVVHGGFPGAVIPKRGVMQKVMSLGRGSTQPSPRFRTFAELGKSVRTSTSTALRMMWGEKSKWGEQGVRDTTHAHPVPGMHYAGEAGVIGALSALAGPHSIQLNGHQHGFAALEEEHPGWRISHGGRVGTLVGLPNGKKQEGAIAVIPLDRDLSKLQDSFFVPVKYS